MAKDGPAGSLPNGREQSITAVVDDATSVVELAVAGRWDPALSARAHTAVRKCLAGHPPGLLLDLLDLDDPEAASAPLWLAVQTGADRMQPPVPVVGCLLAGAPLAGRLDRFGVRRRLSVYPDLAGARDALFGRRPATEQIRARLPPDFSSAATARQIVAAVCREWDLDSLVPRAQLVVSELVANAVEHAGSGCDLIVTRLGRHSHGLRVTVRDRDPRLPRPSGPAEPGRPGQRGRGLHIVEAAAQAWGALPTRSGKQVWATLRETPTRRT